MPTRPLADVSPRWYTAAHCRGTDRSASWQRLTEVGAQPRQGLHLSPGAHNAESVWDHRAATISTPYEAGESGKIVIKIIDDRGNEPLVVKDLKKAAS